MDEQTRRTLIGQRGDLHSAITNGDVSRILDILRSRAGLKPNLAKFMDISKFIFKDPQFDHEGVSPLHDAVLCNNPELFEHLIREGADIKLGTVNGLSLLSFALSKKYCQIAKLLIKHGAKVNFLERDGCTPMYRAIWRGSPTDLIEDLLNAGVSKEAVTNTKTGKTPLIRAIEEENIPVVKFLLEKSVNVNKPMYLQQTTPLQIALEMPISSRQEVVRLLLKYGADVEAKHSHHLTPLGLAAKNNDVEVLKLLISAGADVNRVFSVTDFTSKELQMSALICAIQRNCAQATRYLIESGARDDIKKLLQIALLVDVNNQNEKDHREIIQLFLGVILEFSFETDFFISSTAIEGLNWIALEEFVRHRITKSPSKFLNDVTFMSIFQAVFTFKRKYLIEQFLSFGADFKALTNSNDLDDRVFSSLPQSSATLKTLIRYGMPIEEYPLNSPVLELLPLIKNQHHLIKGIYSNHPETVRKMLEEGAEARCYPREGRFPLHETASRGYTEVVTLLLKHGLPPNIPDSEGRTALYHAALAGHFATCVVLLQYGACLISTRDITTNLNIRRLLHRAHHFFTRVKNNDLKLVQDLDKKFETEDFNVIVNCVNRRGNTLMAEALSCGFKDIAVGIMALRLKKSSSV